MMKSAKQVRLSHNVSAELENLKSEVSVLRRTVDSKTEAVNILRQQLAEVHEQNQHRYSGDAESVDRAIQVDLLAENPKSDSCVTVQSAGILAELLSVSKRENKLLQQDVLDLKCKLHDAQADLKVLRRELRMSGCNISSNSNIETMQDQYRRQEKMGLIKQLEDYKEKATLFEKDIQSLQEDKEELIKERDSASSQVTLLSRQMREEQENALQQLRESNCLLKENLQLVTSELSSLKSAANGKKKAYGEVICSSSPPNSNQLKLEESLKEERLNKFSRDIDDRFSSEEHLEEIVSLDQIDSYVENLRKQQRLSQIVKENAEPTSKCEKEETEKCNETEATVKEDEKPDKKRDEKPVKKHEKPVVKADGKSKKSNRSSSIEETVSKIFEDDPLLSISVDEITAKNEQEQVIDDDFISDYDSDDETFAAELSNWQQNTIGQMNKVQQK